MAWEKFKPDLKVDGQYVRESNTTPDCSTLDSFTANTIAKQYIKSTGCVSPALSPLEKQDE